MSLNDKNVWGDIVVTVCLFWRENWRCISDFHNSCILADISVMDKTVSWSGTSLSLANPDLKLQC